MNILITLVNTTFKQLFHLFFVNNLLKKAQPKERSVFFIAVLMLLPGIIVHAQTNLPLNGVYNIKSDGSGNFISLKQAADTYNTYGITGNSTLIIGSDLTEAATVQFLGTAPGSTNFTLTITTDNTVKRTVQGDLNGPLIQFTGANNIIIDGINPATEANPTAPLLVFSNIYTTTASPTLRALNIIPDGTNNGQGIRIRNTEFALAQEVTDGGAAIYHSTDSLFVESCYLHDANQGISSNNVKYLRIQNNIIKENQYSGIVVTPANTGTDISITGNVISDMVSNTTSGIAGILVNKQQTTGVLNVSNNKLYNFTLPATGFNISGILIATSAASTVNDNMIRDFTSNSLNSSTQIEGLDISVGAATPSLQVLRDTIRNITAGLSNIPSFVVINSSGVPALVKNCLVENISSNYTVFSDFTPLGIFVSGRVDIDACTVRNIKNPSGEAVGIFGEGQTGTISNCMISDIAGILGIGINAIGTINIYHNTIRLTGKTNDTDESTLIDIGDRFSDFTPSTVTLKNNILSQEVPSGSAQNYILTIQSTNATASGLNAANNRYNVVAGNVAKVVTNRAAQTGTTYATLANWSAFSGDNSKTNSPTFVSLNNLHLSGASTSDFSLAVPLIPTIMTDFDGDSRTACFNGAGADNITSVDPVTGVLFVKTTPSGTGDGSSWDNAFDGSRLAWFLNQKAVNGTTVYVAAGTYYPYNSTCDVLSDPRASTFNINTNVTLKGGYSVSSTGTDITNRNMKANVTRLSGNFQADGLAANNSYHVMIIQDGVKPYIEGFYVSDGYADDITSVYEANGGGILKMKGAISPDTVYIRNMVIENNTANFGGGVYFWDNFATVLDSVIIRNNVSTSGFGGGAIFAWGNFALFSSTVNGNTGSGIVSWQGDMAIRNSTITDNQGYGISAVNGSADNPLSLRIISTTISDNTSEGIRMERRKVDYPMNLNMDNNLIINNQVDNSLMGGNIDLSGANPVNIVDIKYSIIGVDSLFKTNRADRSLLPVPVSLDVLQPNGGWGDTRALLDVCDNPAVGAGNPDLLSNLSTTGIDQRGVPRNNPPAIGAYDGFRFVPTTTWTGTLDSNWNNAGNWSNGVPMECSYVIIPKVLSNNNYPILQNVQPNYAQPVCDTIEFKMVGEVAQQQYLQYRHAKVELTIPPNQWYMVSPPLRNMYSGDYYLVNESVNRQNPSVYMMKYQSENPETGAPAILGNWSKPFNSLTQDLTPGLGYVVWVDKSNDTDSSTFHLPQDSTTYAYYYENGGYWYTDPRTMSRTNSGRFIYETGTWNGTQGSSVAPSANPFTLPVDGSNPTTIVGNPFMSHLDFTAFYTANNTSIDNSYYIWSGGSYITNIVTQWGTISTDPTQLDFNSMIAPLQSFIVKKVDGASNFTSLNFSFGTMSKTYPDANTFRSSGTKIPDLLHLEVLRNGKHQSAIALLYRKGQSNGYSSKKDALTLFNDSIEDITTIYALLNGKGASIRTVGDLSEPIELGIRTSLKGNLTFNMIGLDDLDPKLNVFIEDKVTGKTQNLRENPIYTFTNNTGDVKGRFFLKITDNGTGIEDVASGTNIQISSKDNELYIESSDSDPIRHVEIYNMVGQLLIQKIINQSQSIITLPDEGKVFIVKVQTSKNQVSRKIIK